jgi:hypothetical protein
MTAMQDFTYIHNKKLAIIMIEKNGDEDSEGVVITGIAKWQNGHLSVYRGEDTPEFPIPDDTLDRIKLVAPEVKDILEEAEYSIMLSVGPIPEKVDPNTLNYTGFTWPKKDE